MTSIDPRIRQFDSELDVALDGQRCWRFSGPETLYLIGHAIEICYARGASEIATHLERGLAILAPRLLRQAGGDTPTLEDILEPLYFAGHYYSLRDRLYYSYKLPGSCEWLFEGNRVVIRFGDRTVPRQYWLKASNLLIASYSSKGGRDIVEMLRGVGEFEASDASERACKLIEKEADQRLSCCFAVIPSSSTTSLGRYLYCDFYIVLRLLLIKALYHCYQAIANGNIGAVHIEKRELIDALYQDGGLSLEAAHAVLRDITYDDDAFDAQVQPMYCGLYDLPGRDQLLMIPHTFAMQDSLVNILRVVAKRDPAHFQRCVAPVLDRSFEQAICRIFEQHGFECHRRLSLAKFDRSLPDIDLLVISTEPTLGYFVYLCELKGMIPAQWSKDHLRVLADVPKALTQLRRTLDFLKSQTGAKFIRSLLPPEGLPHFGPEFAVVIHPLVITSDNAGMFFADSEFCIIDYRTLARIVERSDGDVTYINHFLAEFGELFDENTKTVTVECTVGDRRVEYEGVSFGTLFDFEDNSYRSIGMDEEIAKNFIKDGHHPFDVFKAE